MVDLEQQTRDALSSWRAQRFTRDLGDPPDGLWHYTDAGGLRGILENDELWASETRFLNDATEISYGLEVASEATNAAVKSGRWSDSTCNVLWRAMAKNGANLPAYWRAKSQIYVACFCEDGDLLSQWRAYAGRDAAGGYAIEFRHSAPLTGWIEHQSRPTLRLQKVIYDPDVQMTEFTKLIDLLAPIYDAEHEELQMKALMDGFTAGLLEFATFCKHPSFAAEREWRVVYDAAGDAEPFEVKYRSPQGTLVPYVSLKLPAAVGTKAGHLPVSQIRTGPGLEPGLKELGLWRYVRSVETFKDVKICGSSTPLRL